MFDMANDSGIFRTRHGLESAKAILVGNRFHKGEETWLPLIEAKMVHIFDHRFGTYEGQTAAQENQGKLPEFDESAHADIQQLTHPRYWIAEAEVSQRLSGRWEREWLIGWRDITNAQNQRTVISSLIPRVAVGNTVPLMIPHVAPTLAGCLYASLCCFALDYAARQKVGGTHLTYGYLKQLPVFPPSTYQDTTPWDNAVSLQSWILPRVLELTHTAQDMEPFARDAGYCGAPFRWDPERRFQLRCELDAAFFHLYGLSRDDIDYVMDTFPIVRKNDEKTHGEYRTKRVILETHDALSKAVQTGKPYRTPLEPLPASPGASHGVFAANLP